MDDYVGTIIIGTKVDNNGLRKGLKETQQLASKYDKNTTISQHIDISEEELIKDMNKFRKKSSKFFKGLDTSNLSDDIFEAFGNGEIIADELTDGFEKGVEQARKMVYKKFEKAPIPVKAKVEEVETPQEVIDPAQAKMQLAIAKSRQKIAGLEEKITTNRAKVIQIQEEIDKLREEEGQLEHNYELWLEIDERINNGEALTPAELPFYEEYQDADEIISKMEERVQDLNDKQSQLNTQTEKWVQDLKIAELEYNAIQSKSVKLQSSTGDVSEGFEGMSEGMEGMEQGFGMIIKKVGKLALALVGIRTLITIITRAFNTLSQYNTELATKIDNVRLVLAVALEPIITRIINLIVTLLGYLNAITKTFFGLDLYARASELATKRMADNMASGASSATEMKKQLAGFDEMNIIEDTSTAGGGGGGGGGGGFTGFELPEMKIPKWLQWIIDNIDIIAGIAGVVGGLFMAIKLGLDPLMGLGIGSIIAGIVLLIIDIIDFIKDPTWENFKTLIDDFLIDLALIIGGIAVLTGQWIPGVIAIVMLLAGLIIRYWDQIKEVLSTVWKWIDEHVIQPVANAFKWLWDKIVTIFKPIIDFFASIFSVVYDNIRITIDNIKKILAFCWEVTKQIFSPVVKWFKDVWDKIKEIFTPIVQWFSEMWQKVFNKIKEIMSPIINFFTGIWNTVKSIFTSIVVTIANAISGAFKTAINALLSSAEYILNAPIKAINSAIDVLNKLGLGLTRLRTFSLPRMAVGGIINQPGRGVPVGGAIAGEAGREGILPLTDRQAMAELGKEIGKWVTIQATVPVYIGNRQISRVIQDITADRQFAMNS